MLMFVVFSHLEHKIKFIFHTSVYLNKMINIKFNFMHSLDVVVVLKNDNKQ